MNKETLIYEINKLGIQITDNQVKQIEIFCDFLITYNKHTNLTAIKDLENIYLKHIFDSLTLVEVLKIKDNKLFSIDSSNEIIKVLDIGTGPGFPGIVLKTIFPYLQITLIDSNNKKINFLKEAVTLLNMDNVEIINERAENFINQRREYYDLVTSRAVAKLNILLELSIPYTKINGCFVAMKGKEDEEETTDGIYAAKKLNCFLKSTHEFNLPIENSNRTLYVFEKKEHTSKEYPRGYDKIIKNPLKKESK